MNGEITRPPRIRLLKNYNNLRNIVKGSKAKNSYFAQIIVGLLKAQLYAFTYAYGESADKVKQMEEDQYNAYVDRQWCAAYNEMIKIKNKRDTYTIDIDEVTETEIFNYVDYYKSSCER